MKRFSTFPLIDNELNRLDENHGKTADTVKTLVEQVEQLTASVKKLSERKKPGRKPKETA